VEAYCVKCKVKRTIKDPQPTWTKTGTPATKGVCPVCGTGLYKMGRTAAHQGLEPPVVEKKARARANKRHGKLVIVESPAKARTLSRYLGKGYRVRASVGHVRDLLRSQLSVDVEGDFQPKYRVPNEKRQVVKELKQEAAKAEEVYLATDPDREGEAIAWHLLEAADIDEERARRVVFHEITRNAIAEAFKSPRGIDMKLVDAQQARRILDRLVGYNLSPLLWSKVRSRLSAGRVQSVALRLVVEREREIRDFKPEEYWSIDGEFLHPEKPPAFVARLIKVGGDAVKIGDESAARALMERLKGAKYAVREVRRSQRERKPQAPFTTSTLQQSASRRLGFTARRTMAVAQQLYEGIELGSGEAVGLITYMRTDSVAVSSQAQQEARRVIAALYGQEYLPAKPPIYRPRSKRAQEAHEAIRPTSVARKPSDLKDDLSRDQFRLYQLIWSRFVASQMRPAIYDTLRVEVIGHGRGEEYIFRVSASSLRFPGFLKVYKDVRNGLNGKPSRDDELQTNMNRLPDLRQGDPLQLQRLIPEQHFTQPPPRFTDATLIRALEEHGIGRPSTYAPILTTLLNRGYVERKEKRLYPTEIGELVNDLLVEHFPGVVDVGFTAKMEERLDEIASGSRRWVEVVRQFYEPFAQQLERAREVMPEARAEPEKIDRPCPRCGKDLVIRHGRFGKFIGCSDFPTCRYTEPWLERIGVLCPQCGGELVERRTRKGRVFFGCENYPECDFSSWKRPLPEPCPNCQGLLVVENREHARCTQCDRRYERKALEKAEGSVA